MFDPKTYISRINMACTIVDVLLIALLILSLVTSYVAYRTERAVLQSQLQQRSYPQAAPLP